MSFEIEEVTDLAALEALRGEWSALCDRSPRTTPFQRPEWLIPWWRAFPPGEPWVLAVRRQGRLAALAPLLLYRKDGIRTVAFCGGGVSDYLDIVTDPETEEDSTAALLAHLAARRDRWQAGDFEPLPGESPLLRVPLPEGLSARTEPRDVCPCLPLPERVEGLPEVAHARQLYKLRAYRRKAAALGVLRLQTADEGSWEEMLDTLIRLHGTRWHEMGQAGMLDGDGFRIFHREVAAGFHARGSLALYVLRLDGSPIAASYGFRERETVYGYLQGFDPERAKLSPGVLMVGAAIEDAIHRGARCFDFLRGQETYKYWWGAKDRETYRRTLQHRSGGAEFE
ncbi:MAG TPA: GNAT family N-acetyltransferase [Thermoanaerobaculia bacterium]|jgi:CelD/BcsL family acetyltransferase involved in cellulose biosynthesis